MPSQNLALVAQLVRDQAFRLVLRVRAEVTQVETARARAGRDREVDQVFVVRRPVEVDATRDRIVLAIQLPPQRLRDRHAGRQQRVVVQHLAVCIHRTDRLVHLRQARYAGMRSDRVAHETWRAAESAPNPGCRRIRRGNRARQQRLTTFALIERVFFAVQLVARPTCAERQREVLVDRVHALRVDRERFALGARLVLGVGAGGRRAVRHVGVAADRVAVLTTEAVSERVRGLQARLATARTRDSSAAKNRAGAFDEAAASSR